MATIMIETPIAFGLTLIVCLALFYYCWRIRKFRHRLTASVQVADAPVQVPAETGIRKEVIITFPTVRANELKVDLKEGLQCPICLVDYAEAEVLRKLPLCGHVFHIRCVDSWLEKQVTCPVCRIVLTAVPRVTYNRRVSHTRRVVSIPETRAVTVPAWVLVNRPLPLPPAIAEEPPNPPSSTDIELQPLDTRGESPLLEHHNGKGWGAVYLETSLGGLSFRAQTKECVDHSSISERWMTESFLFGISSSEENSYSTSNHHSRKTSENSHDGGSSNHHSRKSSENSWSDGSGKMHRETSSWSSRSVQSRSWDFNQPTIHAWQSEFENSTSADEVFELSSASPHRPLTLSPERCSFEFLPVISGGGGDYGLKATAVSPWVPGASRHNYYSQQ